MGLGRARIPLAPSRQRLAGGTLGGSVLPGAPGAAPRPGRSDRPSRGPPRPGTGLEHALSAPGEGRGSSRLRALPLYTALPGAPRGSPGLVVFPRTPLILFFLFQEKRRILMAGESYTLPKTAVDLREHATGKGKTPGCLTSLALSKIPPQAPLGGGVATPSPIAISSRARFAAPLKFATRGRSREQLGKRNTAPKVPRSIKRGCLSEFRRVPRPVAFRLSRRSRRPLLLLTMNKQPKSYALRMESKALLATRLHPLEFAKVKRKIGGRCQR
jgi:hypothetical protein